MQAISDKDSHHTSTPKKILITGAAKRLGSHLATACIEDGWHVVLHCHQSQDDARALIAQCPPARIDGAGLDANS